ncbi:MAG: hypothetical protein IKG67_15380 [Parasporobacterium sp.]|nr:hypothetical protein [Parasporobacterium sp.]
MLKQQMFEEKIRLQSMIADTKKRLAQLPEGTFFSVRNGNSTKWFTCRNGVKNLIRKADRSLAQLLASRTFYQYLLQQLEEELDAVKAYLRNAGNLNITEYLNNHEEIRRLISDRPSVAEDVRHWMSTPYEKNPMPYKGTLYPTMKGDLVKSLAEQAIANALFLANIPYRYECRISFRDGKVVFYPDFMIMHPETGEIYLWEHFGMSELTYYCRKNADKMYVYFENGFIPGKNLICTAETDTIRLTPAQIQKQIDYYFGIPAENIF